MSGLALQERLCRDGYSIPTVMITAQRPRDAHAAASRAGASAFLTKPFDWKALLSVGVGTLLEVTR